MDENPFAGLAEDDKVCRLRPEQVWVGVRVCNWIETNIY